MKAISVALEDSLLIEMNKKTKILGITRAELIRNAVMEYLFRFGDLMDSRLLQDAVEANEASESLEEVAKELRLKR